jgi:hypothetical protein
MAPASFPRARNNHAAAHSASLRISRCRGGGVFRGGADHRLYIAAGRFADGYRHAPILEGTCGVQLLILSYTVTFLPSSFSMDGNGTSGVFPSNRGMIVEFLEGRCIHGIEELLRARSWRFYSPRHGKLFGLKNCITSRLAFSRLGCRIFRNHGYIVCYDFAKRGAIPGRKSMPDEASGKTIRLTTLSSCAG